MAIVGRTEEISALERYYYSERPELIIVYGRRRVGKTFLVKEFFGDKLTFCFTGRIGKSNRTSLTEFDRVITEYGGEIGIASKNWSDAFFKLKKLLKKLPEGRKVIFIDEMPWLDTGRSDFLSAFDYFWNSWASACPDILLIGCGSATSWITKNIFQNRGGLHNRVTGRVHLAPFTIGECEAFLKTRGVEIARYDMAECYMIFGGIPFYLNMFVPGLSLSQNVDRLCFADNAPLSNEFDELYGSLFSNPNRHISIVEALAERSSGLSRNELLEAGNFQSNGHLTKALKELEQCDFIVGYTDYLRNKNGGYYYLKDPFTLFYLRYMKSNQKKDVYYWTNNINDGARRAWSGYAFEQLCRMHLRQIKARLGILGVSTETTSWRSKSASPGAQIDMVIRRKDGVTNLCEIKYAKHPYEITKTDAEALERKRMAFIMETDTKDALHFTMITTFGLERKGYISMIHSEVKLDDLFLI